MSIPPGWYPDPQPTPGTLPAQRWWDGAAWTEHRAPGVPVAPVAQPSAYAVPATTPDGEPLAGWGQRLGAYLLDALILVPFLVLATIPFWGQIGDAFGDYWDQATRSVDTGGDAPSSSDLQRELFRSLFLIGLLNMAISLVYHVGFLMWKQATPGKLALGLRVRRRDVPGPMPLGTVLLRWFTQFWPGFFSAVQYLNYLVSIYSFLDGFLATVGQQAQALHDKAARTNVVRTR